MENVRKHRDIKLVTTDKRRNQLVSEPNYHATKRFSETLLAIEMKKIKVKMNKSVYLGLSILEISKTLMYEFWHDYIKPKYQDNAKLCYMVTDSFIINIKTEDFYEDIEDDVKKRFDTSNYEANRPLPTGKNKKVIRLMKDELGGKILTEFAALRPKTYSYLMDDGNSGKKAKRTKKYVIKRILKFNDSKDCLLNNEIILKSQQRFKCEAHNVYTEEINNITLSSNDDKRLQTFDRITSYLYGILMNNYNKNKTEYYSNWPYIPDHPYRILILGGSGSGKTNALLSLINNQPDINKIYLYAKDPYAAKYQYLINKHEKVGLDHLNDSKAFMEYSNDMSDVYKNIEDYNPDNKIKVLIVFDGMFADTINNKKLKSIVTELFISDRKLKILFESAKRY